MLILQAIVDDYISTAVPVGSRTISRKSGVGFSPATIRNEMSDLEELGYLNQPHTSAGRIPSDKAYRLYVDRLLKVGKLSEDERERMHDSMQSRTAQADGVIRTAAQLLADATGYTAVIVAPKLDTLRIRHVQLVPVSEHEALLILVTNAGILKDAMIPVTQALTPDQLYAISRMLTESLADKPFEALHTAFAEILRDNEAYRRLLIDTLRVIARRIDNEDATDVVVGGRSNLLNYPEYADMYRARSLLALMESREKLLHIFDGRGAGTGSVSVRIGSEIGFEELNDCSLLSVRYAAGEGATGTMGIIGPMRMNYNRVIPVLEFMSRAVSELLADSHG